MIAWIFLVAAGVCGLFTLNAFRPLFRPAPVAIVSFFASWLTKELALHHILWQAVAVVVAVYYGALGEWPGYLALVLTAGSWWGLWILHGDALKTDQLVESALLEGLGDDYRHQIPVQLGPALDSTFNWGRVMRVFPIRRSAVERIKNVPYCDGHRRQKLDVYRCKSRPENCPTLLYVHGGAWVIGNKDQQGLMTVSRFAEAGWVCFSINYRLAPWGTFPEPLIDVKRAIAWIRQHGAEYGANPDFVVVCGGSAGAHLSSLAALTANDPEYQPGFESVDTRLDGVMGYYGVYDFTNRFDNWPHWRGVKTLLRHAVMKCSPRRDPDAWAKASPIDRLHPDVPPLLLVHGDHDALAPIGDAREFYRAYRGVTDQPSAFLELPGAQHAFEVFPSIRSTHVVDGVLRFATAIYGRHLARQQSTEQPSPDRSEASVHDLPTGTEERQQAVG